MRRKLDVLHQFVRALAPLRAVDRLVQNGLDAVTVGGERVACTAAIEDWPRVARDHVLGAQRAHLLQTRNLPLWSTQPRATNRSDVREGAEEVVRVGGR